MNQFKQDIAELYTGYLLSELGIPEISQALKLIQEGYLVTDKRDCLHLKYHKLPKIKL